MTDTNGKSSHFPDSGPAEDPLSDGAEGSPAPPKVAELSASCARFVLATYKVPLDGTSDTLSLLDQYVKDARDQVQEKPETADLLTASVGAYLGEVMRRAFGGSWFAEGDHAGWRLDFHRVFLTFNPLGMAREALFGEAQDGWHAHLEMDEAERDEVERRLQALGDVDEDEFFLPTTRYDVVALAFEALRASMTSNGTADVTFGPEDYKRK